MTTIDRHAVNDLNTHSQGDFSFADWPDLTEWPDLTAMRNDIEPAWQRTQTWLALFE